MSALLDVILPVFLVIGLGFSAVRFNLIGESAIDGLMKFAQGFAIPCLLFQAIATLEIGENFHFRILATYYGAATIAFAIGLFGARYIFGRPWPDCVAIGFAALFSNSVMMGLPITERAYGPDALGPNFGIIALNAPFCYTLGFIAMEFAKGEGNGLNSALKSIARSVLKNALMMAIALGFAFNLSGLSLPGYLWDAIRLMSLAALPAALFGLGGVISRYRPEGDITTIAYITSVSLFVQPLIVWFVGPVAELNTAEFRSAVLTAAMAPGINAYIFASLYGVGMRVVASSVLLGTALNIITVWVWLAILP